jgi:lipoyl(octanoyl) transferase
MTLEFLHSKNPLEYTDAMMQMDERVNGIINGTQKELIWFLEHPPVLTAGTSAKNEDLLLNDLPVVTASRGGKFTLHAPGQRVCYIMLNLKQRANGAIPDPKKFVKTIEDAVISALAKIGISGEIRNDRVGVWVLNKKGIEEKICAIGVKFKGGVTMHGFAINVENDLNLFKSIVPCGIKEYGVCSIRSLGFKTTMEEFDKVLQKEIERYFY